MYKMATHQFNVVRSILQKSIFDENVIHIILTEYWKDLKNKRKVLVDWINFEQLSWEYLSENPNAIDLLKHNKHYINWFRLSVNPNAIDLIEDRIKYEKSLTEIEYVVLKYKINWSKLSSNPNAIELLKKNPDKISWTFLSQNPNTIQLLEENQDKINWILLSENQNAIDLLKINKTKINWELLSVNPSIFEDEPMPTI